MIDLSEPVDVGLAVDAPGAVTPVVVEVVFVPLVDALKVLRQRNTADWYLWVRSVKQAPEPIEGAIQADLRASSTRTS